MDRATLFALNFTHLINRAPQYVHDATQSTMANWHSNLVTRIGYSHSATQAVGGTHCNGAHHAVANLLLYFQGQAFFSDRASIVLYYQRIVDFGYVITWKFNVYHRTNTLNNFSLTHLEVPHFILILYLMSQTSEHISNSNSIAIWFCSTNLHIPIYR